MRSTLSRLGTRRGVLTLVVAAVLASAVTIFFLARDGHGAAAASDRTVAASLGTIRQAITATGTIEPASQDQVNFQVAGRVTAVSVGAGQTVAAGSVLATVDSAALQATLAQAQASLANAQARAGTDSSNGASSTAVAADNAAVTAAQGQVSAAQSALSEATLRSPISGVVAAVNLTVGQEVSANGSSAASGSASGAGATSGSGSGSGASGSSSSSAQFLVLSTDSWVVNTSVDDTQIDVVQTGDQAQIVPDGATTPIYGTVTSVALIASNSSGVATFPVVVAVTGNPPGLHAGATGSVSLIYRQLSNVLEVPTLALHPQGASTVVYVQQSGKQITRAVTVGASAGGFTQVTSGLSEGEQVIVPVARATGRSGGTSTRTGGSTGGGTRGGFGGGGFGGGGFGGGNGGSGASPGNGG